MLSEAAEHHHGRNTAEERLTDGGSNARPQAVRRRSPGFEVMRRKVVLSTHLNPTSIWLWGRTAKQEEGSCQLTGITGTELGSAGHLHLWRFSCSLSLFCADQKLALLLADLPSFTEHLVLSLTPPSLAPNTPPFPRVVLLPDKQPLSIPLKRGMLLWLFLLLVLCSSPHSCVSLVEL